MDAVSNFDLHEDDNNFDQFELEDLQMIVDILGESRYDLIKKHLKMNRNDPNRRQLIIETVLMTVENGYSEIGRNSSENDDKSLSKKARLSSESHSTDRIFDMAQQVKRQFPDIDPNFVYNRLIDSEDADLARNRLIEELMVAPPEIPKQAPTSSRMAREMDRIPSPDICTNAVCGFVSENEQNQFKEVVAIFTNIDPYFVVEKITQDQWTTEKFIDELTHKSYPKLKDRLSNERLEIRRQRFFDVKYFHVEEFLILFNDPAAYFRDKTRVVSQLYIQHAKTYLLNTYLLFTEEYLNSKLESHNNHLLPVIEKMEILNKNQATIQSKRPRALVHKRRIRKMRMYVTIGQERVEKQKWPEEIDENFFRELQFYKFRNQIEAHVSTQKRRLEIRHSEVSICGQFRECPICCSDEILPEHLLSCVEEHHEFCRQCVVEHAKNRIGDGAHRIGCLATDCPFQISVHSLRPLLRPDTMALFLRRCQQAELFSANLPQLETCPFCEFALVIDNPDERLFLCRNPGCLKESCLQCKEESHIPFKCEEVEKDVETRMRTFVENRMAESMIRICPSCKKRIIKISGCNVMTCSCGAKMCYECSAYLSSNICNHFKTLAPGDSRKRVCSTNTPLVILHEQTAKKAGEEARQKYRKDHPGMEQFRDVDVDQLVLNVDISAKKVRKRKL